MEAGNCAARNRDEHEAPDRRTGRMHIVHMRPDLRDGVSRVGEDTDDNADRHDDQAHAEQRIDLADDFVDRNKGCDEVVRQNNDQPEQRGRENAGNTVVLAQRNDQAGRADCEYRADHDQQDDREHAHNVLHRVAEVFAGDLRDGRAVVSLTDHAGEIVVYAAGKDGAEGDPQKYDRAPERALKCAEDRAEAGNVQQLNQKELPLRHNDVVHAVIDAYRRSLAVIRAEGFVYDLTISKIAGDQQQ